MSYHHTIAFGRATADAKVIESKNGKKFAAFTLAVNTYLGEERGSETTFYECLVFTSKQIETISTHVKKGDLMVVDGAPSVNAYLSNKATPKAAIKIIVNSFYMFKDIPLEAKAQPDSA